MNELFAEEDMEMESPKLKWMRKHKVSVENTDIFDDICVFVGDFAEAFDEAHDGMKPFEYSLKMQFGETEHDALCNLAEINGWKLWNEE